MNFIYWSVSIKYQKQIFVHVVWSGRWRMERLWTDELKIQSSTPPLPPCTVQDEKYTWCDTMRVHGAVSHSGLYHRSATAPAVRSSQGSFGQLTLVGTDKPVSMPLSCVSHHLLGFDGSGSISLINEGQSEKGSIGWIFSRACKEGFASGNT